MWSPTETYAQYGVFDILFNAQDDLATALIDPNKARRKSAAAAQIKHSYRSIRLFQREHQREYYQDKLEHLLRHLNTQHQQLMHLEDGKNDSQLAIARREYQHDFADAKTAVARGKFYAPMGQPFTTEAPVWR